MNKAYNPINWANNETPINETNLNKMSDGLSMVDDRVIALDKTLGGYSDEINEALEASSVAQEAKEIAVESAERAEEALKNAEAVVGVGIATKDKAGLVKADDVHIDNDGTLKYITSTTSATMPNSHKGRLLIEEIGGVSEQGSTTGAQLFDISTANAGYIDNTGEVVTTNTNRVSDYIASNGNITISTNAVMASMGVAFYDSNKGFISRIYTSKVDVINSESVTNCAYIRAWFNVDGGSLDVTRLSIYKPMINAGTTTLPWEPYTGGQPSPSPSYPQKIKNVVVSGVKTHGKNFANFPDGEITQNGVTAKTENSVITLTGTPTVESGIIIQPTAELISHNQLKDGTTYYAKDCTARIYMSDGTLKYFGQFTFDKSTMISIRLYYDVKVANYVNGMVLKPHLTTEPNAKFEPYTEASITLSSPIELCSIGDVQDFIDVENGVIRKRFKKVLFDGSVDEGWRKGNVTEFNRFLTTVSDGKANGNVLCSQSNNVAISSNLNLYMDNDFATLEGWIAHLQENPMTIVYQLATPTTEALPTADQIALNSLATHDGITYLEFDSEIEPTFEVEYGTSKVGGYTLEGLLTGRNAELLQQSNVERITALETALINNV